MAPRPPVQTLCPPPASPEWNVPGIELSKLIDVDDGTAAAAAAAAPEARTLEVQNCRTETADRPSEFIVESRNKKVGMC